MLSVIKTFFFLILLGCLLLRSSVLTPVLAANENPNPDFQEQAERLKQKINQAEGKIESYTLSEKKYLSELAALDRELNEIQRKTASVEAELTGLGRNMAIARQDINSLEIYIRDAETYTAQRLAALYKLTRIGQMQIIGSADTINEFFRRKIAVREIIAQDQQVITALIAQKKQLSAALLNLRQDQARQKELQTDYQRQQTLMTQKINHRTDLLTATRKEKSSAMVAIKSLQATAAELDQKIAQLRLQAEKTEKTPLVEPKELFSQYLGLLKMPVKGKIITEFGEYKDTEYEIAGFRNGIDIKAEKGDSFRAVRSGKVLFANWFKGYGNLIIIDHGDSYYTLYAHAKELYKTEGDQVKTDEVIGAVGDTGSLEGVKLHFEVRHHGKPIDPIKWLKQQ